MLKKSVIVVATLALAVTVSLSAQDSTKKADMNDWSFAKVKQMFSNPQSAARLKKMAKANGAMLMGGMPINGQAVTLEGELTGADCYLSAGEHGHEHALCAKACVAHGGPVVFIAQDGSVYLVLPPRDGVPMAEGVLDDLGKPGVTVKGQVVESHGLKALSVHSVSG